MERITCRNCGTSVIARDDGTCPTCQRPIPGANVSSGATSATPAASAIAAPAIMPSPTLKPDSQERRPNEAFGRGPALDEEFVPVMMTSRFWRVTLMWVAFALAGWAAMKYYGRPWLQLTTGDRTPIAAFEIDPASGEVLIFPLPAQPDAPVEPLREEPKGARIVLVPHLRGINLAEIRVPAARLGPWMRTINWWFPIAFSLLGVAIGLAIPLWFTRKLWRWTPQGLVMCTWIGIIALGVALVLFFKDYLFLHPFLAPALFLPVATVYTAAAMDALEGQQNSLARGARLAIRILVGLFCVIGYLLLFAGLILRGISLFMK